MTPSSTDRREPLVRVRGRVTVATKHGPDIDEEEFEWTPDNIPEELMKAAEELLGDAQSRVSVTMDLSSKNFGNGASAMVTVSLNCNQDDETIADAVELATDSVKDFVALAYDEAVDAYEDNKRKIEEAK